MIRSFLSALLFLTGEVLAQPGPFPPFPPSQPLPTHVVPPRPTVTITTPLAPKADLSITVTDVGGEPVPSVTIYLSRTVRSTTPRLIAGRTSFSRQEVFQATSDRNGFARIFQLSVGTFSVCLSPPEPFLSNCEWGRAKSYEIKSDGQRVASGVFVVERGNAVELSVKDPRGLLKGVRIGDPVQVPLKVGLLETWGTFHSARLIRSQDGELSYLIYYPALSKAWPVYYSHLFDTRSDTGKITPGSGSRDETWTQAERTAGRHSIELIPTQKRLAP
jgi:hypothetical protein